MHPLRLYVLLHLLLPHHALAAPFLHALRARAPAAQPPRCELRFPASVPAAATGGDFALSMLRRARRNSPRMPLLCLHAASLPVRSSSLDAVTLHSVLSLLPDQRAALREVARVLRAGGRAVLLEPQAGRRATLLGLAPALPSPRRAPTAAFLPGLSGLLRPPPRPSRLAG